MVPILRHIPHTPRLLLTLASVASQHVPSLRLPLSNHFAAAANGSLTAAHASVLHSWAKRDDEPHDAKFIVFAVLIPVLVLLSGLFAGLTLGYMSLDETQLHVLSVSGTP